MEWQCNVQQHSARSAAVRNDNSLRTASHSVCQRTRGLSAHGVRHVTGNHVTEVAWGEEDGEVAAQVQSPTAVVIDRAVSAVKTGV